jgi:hypothetical protein
MHEADVTYHAKWHLRTGMVLGGLDFDLECKNVRTHHYDDHKHVQSRNDQPRGLIDEEYGCTHRNNIQTPRFPQKGSSQLFQMLGQGTVAIVNTTVFQKRNKGYVSI